MDCPNSKWLSSQFSLSHASGFEGPRDQRSARDRHYPPGYQSRNIMIDVRENMRIADFGLSYVDENEGPLD